MKPRVTICNLFTTPASYGRMILKSGDVLI